MPRSKDPSRYPQSYFEALKLAKANGQHAITCGDKPKAESLRLNFSSLRAGIMERSYQPFCYYASGFKFLVRVDPPRLLITWGDNDDLSQLVKQSLPPDTPGNPNIAAYAAEHAARDLLHSQDVGAMMAIVDEDEAIRRAREKLGLPKPTAQAEADARSPDQLISDLLKLKR